MKESWGLSRQGVGVSYPPRQYALFGPDFKQNGSPVASHCREMGGVLYVAVVGGNDTVYRHDKAGV